MPVRLLRWQVSRLRRGFSTAVNRQIFAGVVTVIAMTLFANAAGIGRELVVAQVFGTAEVLDAMLIALVAPMFAVTVLANAFGGALIPTYLQVRQTAGTLAAHELFASTLWLVILVMLVADIVLAAAAPLIVSSLGTGLSADTRQLALSLFYWLLPVHVLFGMRNIYAGAINAEKRFGLPSLVRAITPICVIVSLLIAGDRWGIYAMVSGILAGALLELIVMIGVAVRRGIPVIPRWAGMSPDVRAVVGYYGPMVAATSLMAGTVVVDTAMAASLEPGSVAILTYANKIVGLVTGLGAMALGTVVLPHFSEMVAHRDWVSLKNTFRIYANLIVIVCVPITAALFVLSEPITSILFQRGAFTDNDVEIVGRAQAFYVLQIPFYFLAILTVRMLASLKLTTIIMWGSMFNLILNVLLNYLFIQLIGVAGIALATSFVIFFSWSFLYSMLRNRSRNIMVSTGN